MLSCLLFHGEIPNANSLLFCFVLKPFVEDEDVLVESENGKFLWDAVVVDVSKEPETEKVNGYLVHYKNWSSRFDQWVVPDRVVEPNKVNLEVQVSGPQFVSPSYHIFLFYRSDTILSSIPSGGSNSRLQHSKRRYTSRAGEHVCIQVLECKEAC